MQRMKKCEDCGSLMIRNPWGWKCTNKECGKEEGIYYKEWIQNQRREDNGNRG